MRVAVIDLGSNSFHVLVVDGRDDGSFEPLVREKEVLRLADELARRGRLGEEASAAAVDVVRRFVAIARSAGATEIVACGTSAIREAADSAALVESIRAATGVVVHVASGEEEAGLIFGGIRASVVIDPGPALAIDLGGGSLELMVGDNAGLAWSASVPLGAARLTAELIVEDPPSPGGRGRLERRLSTVLAPVGQQVDAFGARMLIGSSGTICSLARLAASRRTGIVPDSVNQLRVGRTDLRAVHDELHALSAAERQRLPGIDARRAELIPAGSAVLMAVMDLFGFDELVTSEWALREGMVLEALHRHVPEVPTTDPRSFRRRAVLALARHHGGADARPAELALIATRLFDGTRRLHGLGDTDRELLELGALLADIGEVVRGDGHERHTEYLVLNGRLRGFSPQEVAVLAALGRYHHRGMPKPSSESFALLSPTWRPRVPALVALLRVADALERAGLTVVSAEVDDSEVRILVEAGPPAWLPELWAPRRENELFERLFGCTLAVRSVDAAVALPPA